MTTTTMSADAIDFFERQAADQLARHARATARARQNGSFARDQWRKAALSALTEGRAFSERSTRALARRWDGRMDALSL